MQNAKQIQDACVFDILDALQAPVLTHAVSWKDSIPQRMLDMVPMARLAALMRHEKLATDVEVSIFIMTAAYEAPMQNDWVDIYTHVSCNVLEKYFGEVRRKEVKAPEQLTDYQENYLLKPLRIHIYEKRRKILKERLKEEKNGQKERTTDSGGSASRGTPRIERYSEQEIQFSEAG